MNVLGIDLGTNSVKSLILDLETGEVLGIGQKGYRYIENTSAEQDPKFVWQMVIESINRAISISGVDPASIRCIGLSGQMHGTVLYDKLGQQISNIITWEDSRCDKAFIESIYEIAGDEVEKSGCGIATGFLGPTVYHIMLNSDVEIGHVLLPTDWLRQELTGERTYLTDYSNASSSGFFDTRARVWNYNLILKLKIDESIFPKVVQSFDVDCATSERVAELTGIRAGTPVAVGGGDQPMSMIGCGVCEPHDPFVLNIGTGSQVARVSHTYLKRDDIIAFCFPGGGYSILGAALSGGASLNWWNTLSKECIETFGLLMPESNIYNEMTKVAERTPPGSCGLIFIPYLSGTRSNPELKASFSGITRHHSYAHFTRAIMEGVIFELYYFYEKLLSQGENIEHLVGAGGGFSSKLWSQIAADIFDKPIKLTLCQEQAALGAALTAGVAIGYFRNLREACQIVRYRPEIVLPKAENTEIYKKMRWPI